MKPIAWNAKLWKESVTQLHEFLNPLIAGLGRSERRVAATRYVEGLLMPVSANRSSHGGAAGRGLAKSATVRYRQPLERGIVVAGNPQEIIPHLEPLEAWVVDETGWVKQGSHSVESRINIVARWASRPIAK